VCVLGVVEAESLVVMMVGKLISLVEADPLAGFLIGLIA